MTTEARLTFSSQLKERMVCPMGFLWGWHSGDGLVQASLVKSQLAPICPSLADAGLARGLFLPGGDIRVQRARAQERLAGECDWDCGVHFPWSQGSERLAHVCVSGLK